MSTDIFIEDSFDSAHWLPNVPNDHKCKRVHGHTYRIRIDIEGKVGEKTGWIIDYAEVKAIWEPIKQVLDHRVLNDIIPNPTCELLAYWIVNQIADVGLNISRLELRETERCGVTIYIP